MILFLFLFGLLHPYIKKEFFEIDSAPFYKAKLREIMEKNLITDFPMEKSDSLIFFRVMMFRDLGRGLEKKYYKYVIERDSFMNLLYIFKKGFYENVYKMLDEKKFNKSEYYILYLLSSLKLKKIPEILPVNFFKNSLYYPYILYLTSLFQILKGNYLEAIETLTELDDEFLREDKDFILSLSLLNEYDSIEKIEDYLKKYPDKFYTDTLCFIAGNYYYIKKSYKNSHIYFKKLVDKKGKFYKPSLEFLIEVKSLIGEDVKKLLKEYENNFGQNEIFHELVKKSIFNFYSRKHFKEVIEIYEDWGDLIKEKTFSLYIFSLLKTGNLKMAIDKVKSEKNRFLKGVGYFKIGEYYEINEDYENAIKYYDFSLRYIKEKEDFYQNIFLKKLLLEVKLGKLPDPKTAYNIFVKKFPESASRPILLREIVEYLLKERRLYEAFNYQREIFELEKQRIDFAKLLEIAFYLGNYEFLDSVYWNVEEKFKDIAGFYFAKFIYKKKKNPFDAISVFKEIIEKSEGSEYERLAKYYVGEIYKAFGKFEESEEILLSIAEENDTVSFKSVCLLSEIYKEKGEIQKMEELLAKHSLKWEGEKKGHILFRLAEAKEIKGELEDAKNIYLLSADNLFPSLDSVALALYRSANLTNLKEEKRAFLERARSLTQNPLFKREIEKSLIDLK